MLMPVEDPQSLGGVVREDETLKIFSATWLVHHRAPLVF